MVDACTDGGFGSPPAIASERQAVADAYATSEGGVASVDILNAVFPTRKREVVGRHLHVGVDKQPAVGAGEPVAHFGAEDECAEFACVAGVVPA